MTIDGLIPEDPLMAIAWRDCLMWAVGQENIMRAFRSETGVTWEPSRVLESSVAELKAARHYQIGAKED